MKFVFVLLSSVVLFWVTQGEQILIPWDEQIQEDDSLYVELESRDTLVFGWNSDDTDVYQMQRRSRLDNCRFTDSIELAGVDAPLGWGYDHHLAIYMEDAGKFYYSSSQGTDCIDGYKLRVRVAEPSASPSPSALNAYGDDAVPEITYCPKNIIVNTSYGQESVRVRWLEPTAYDYESGHLTNRLISTRDVFPGAWLRIGDYLVEYQFSDSVGQQVFCSFMVMVQAGTKNDQEHVQNMDMNFAGMMAREARGESTAAEHSQFAGAFLDGYSTANGHTNPSHGRRHHSDNPVNLNFEGIANL